MDARPLDTQDLSTKARERVRIGPVPAWVTPCSYDPSFKTQITGEVTNLASEEQAHAELSQVYVRFAVRLENMRAVRNFSQWQVEFDPQTESVLLHSIKIRRGS